ncbi:hypothetical protein C5167_034213 [Papaver somniferum]|uniref:Uncharacterized protein n=1 Tax=Papaver somniferum TaxID=3469 RepID=A0A4Y7KGI5_PAPSO|nr:hypothetical protein C5167_034213 [Papaver somniferum]
MWTICSLEKVRTFILGNTCGQGNFGILGEGKRPKSQYQRIFSPNNSSSQPKKTLLLNFDGCDYGFF